MFSRRLVGSGRCAPVIRNTFLRAFSSGQDLKRTVLHDWHLQHGGKMVPFCGWDMPVQYPDGVLKSHLHCRENASLFDVSHMHQLRFRGSGRFDFLESLVVADLKSLPVSHGTLSLLTNERGGIIDDTVISKHEDSLYMVLNAGCADKDLAHIYEHLQEYKRKGGDCTIEDLNLTHSLVALQGPKAAEVLARFVPIDVDITSVNFMNNLECQLSFGSTQAKAIVTRCGYTGEDGFEISVPHESMVAFVDSLAKEPEVLPAGLGARDSLRLEAGLCLYGNDIDETITPVTATLAWTIHKRRRQEGGFLGSDVILKQLEDKAGSRRRVGFVVEGGVAREHSKLFDGDGNEVGEITSGTFGPSVKKAVAMGYVERKFFKPGNELSVRVRNRELTATVTKMPFVPSGYYHRD